jgi:hypothetical protein
MLREMENGKDLKVIALYAHNNGYYIGKGISVSIILKPKEIFRKRIISSINLKPAILGERICKDAITKVWQRLVDGGEALYCEENDHFYLL